MLTTSVLGLSGIFTLNILFGMYYGFGFRHYWFFELEHFFGGFFVAMFLMNFTDSVILIFAWLAIITFLWELTEYLIFKFRKSAKLNPGWKDTILDIILNFSGAAVFIFINFLI